MTGFKLIAPPKNHGSLPMLVVLVMAALVGTIVLSNFIDALHLSMARGEDMRAAHRVVPPAHFDAGTSILISMAPAQKANR